MLHVALRCAVLCCLWQLCLEYALCAQVIDPQSWDMMFERLRALPSSTRHVVMVTTVPVVYPQVRFTCAYMCNAMVLPHAGRDVLHDMCCLSINNGRHSDELLLCLPNHSVQCVVFAQLGAAAWLHQP